MHRPAQHQGVSDTPQQPATQGPPRRVWLIAGTGEGPPLAERLLANGWIVRVSVVSAAATRAYPPHPRLEIRAGALGGDVDGGEAEPAILNELRSAMRAGMPFRWVIDASHPFAVRISAALAGACGSLGQPLLRLQRPLAPEAGAAGAGAGEGAKTLPGLAALAGEDLAGRRLLLAIGGRRLAEALAYCPAAIPYARLLPHPGALRQAMAAGLRADRVACLRPPADPDEVAAVEAALCRRWQIEVVLVRRSGGPSEAHWRRICAAQGLRLLLLERPPEPEGIPALPLEELVARVGAAGLQRRTGRKLGGAPPPSSTP
jgi:precorrin-6A/cobalt-precorrin-6A reductase